MNTVSMLTLCATTKKHPPFHGASKIPSHLTSLLSQKGSSHATKEEQKHTDTIKQH